MTDEEVIQPLREENTNKEAEISQVRESGVENQSSKTEINVDDTSLNQNPSKHMEMTKSEAIEHILEEKEKIFKLITNIRSMRAVCEKYQNENQYLQEYVGSLMKNGEL